VQEFILANLYYANRPGGAAGPSGSYSNQEVVSSNEVESAYCPLTLTPSFSCKNTVTSCIFTVFSWQLDKDLQGTMRQCPWGRPWNKPETRQHAGDHDC
jgi:hypothetical protein